MAEVNESASLLGMAQKVHDDFIADGQRQADELVSNAQAEAEQLLADAEQEANRLVFDAEQKAKEITENARKENEDTLARTEKLKAIEVEYRLVLAHAAQSILDSLKNAPEAQGEQAGVNTESTEYTANTAGAESAENSESTVEAPNDYSTSAGSSYYSDTQAHDDMSLFGTQR